MRTRGDPVGKDDKSKERNPEEPTADEDYWALRATWERKFKRGKIEEQVYERSMDRKRSVQFWGFCQIPDLEGGPEERAISARNARTQLASAVVGVAPQFPRRKAGRKERRKEVQDESTQYAYVNDDAVTARSGYRGVALRSDIRQAPRGYIWRPFPSLVAMLHVNRHVTGRELDDAKKQTHVAEPEHEHEPDRWKMARARGRPGLLDVSSPIHR
ncbi:hypothetical protein AXG93_3384s1760 [Marchantia polymorpha subsp. ruderalis]|uniref:Uncharacterized protein n=1 Tax=Marchantia polymorpha subsp. ruderalis TaxID=1480154 RepID=A0A176WH88_MARPO|nr:hypothetical protein AXG93_3384s1760 [Marchantia polymorpha subsp. ruderalis]